MLSDFFWDICHVYFRDMGYFCKYLKGYEILGPILGIWGKCFLNFGIFAIFILGIWDIFQSN